jgi:hypothetical protein
VAAGRPPTPAHTHKYASRLPSRLTVRDGRWSRYLCPRRVPWCEGHPKYEIKDARTPGNELFHHCTLAEVPFTIGPKPGTVHIALQQCDEPGNPFAYLQTVGGDGGAELDMAGIDRLITALRRTRRTICVNRGTAPAMIPPQGTDTDERQHPGHADLPDLTGRMVVRCDAEAA